MIPLNKLKNWSKNKSKSKTLDDDAEEVGSEEDPEDAADEESNQTPLVQGTDEEDEEANAEEEEEEEEEIEEDTDEGEEDDETPAPDEEDDDETPEPAAASTDEELASYAGEVLSDIEAGGGEEELLALVDNFDPDVEGDPPAWASDADAWQKAQAALDGVVEDGDENYYPVLVHVYEKAGGTIEAPTSGAEKKA